MTTEIKFDLDEVVERLANYPATIARNKVLEARIIVLESENAKLRQVLRDTAHDVALKIRTHLEGK